MSDLLLFPRIILHDYSHLINGTRNQAEDILPIPKDVREGVGEGRHSLHCREGHLAHVIAVGEPKYCLCLVHCNTLLYTKDVLVEFRALTARRNSTEHLQSQHQFNVVLKCKW